MTESTAEELLREIARIVPRRSEFREDRIRSVNDKIDAFFMKRRQGLEITQIVSEVAAGLCQTEYRDDSKIREANITHNLSGIVIAMPSSDDLIEFYGAFRDETGHEAYVNVAGVSQPENWDRRFYGMVGDTCVWVTEDAERGFVVNVPEWLPHETFTIVEDGDPYGVGVVFRLDHLA